MTPQQFTLIFEDQMARCESTLFAKRQEYAPDTDVLANFKAAAGLTRSTPREALAGMMLKHTVSLYDMAREDVCRPIEVWDEKITDHICYLILLAACVREEIDNEH